RARLIAFRHGMWSAPPAALPRSARALAHFARRAVDGFPGPAVRCVGLSLIPVHAFCGFVVISSRAPSTYAQKFAPQFGLIALTCGLSGFPADGRGTRITGRDFPIIRPRPI